jgi:hypothetical protein
MNLKIAFRTTAAFALTAALGGAVVAVQLYNTVNQAQQAREVAIQHWLDANPNGSEVVSRYREKCESGPVSSAVRKSVDRSLSFAECSAHVGSASLADVIQKANDSVTAPAPLRWL